MNVKKELTEDSEEPDFSRLDGFEELSEEFQEKIRKAIELGHVEDEEWKGVSLPSSISTLRSFPLKIDQLMPPRTLNATALDKSACMSRLTRARERPMRLVDSILYPDAI